MPYQPLRKLLGALDGRSGLRVSENLEPGRTESIHDAGRQGRFRSHDRQVHPMFQGESLEALDIRVLEGHILGHLADPRIAGGAEDLPHLGRPGQGIHDGMLATAAADHQDRLLEAVFHTDILGGRPVGHAGFEKDSVHPDQCLK